MRTQATPRVNGRHGGDVFLQAVVVENDCRRRQLVDIHSAGEGTRTPNTQDLNLLPLPIGLHRRHEQGTGGTRGVGVKR